MTRRRSDRRRDGFALPTVLTVTTILTLIFIVCLVALQDLTKQVRDAAADVDLQRQALSAEAEVAYFATTVPFSPLALKIGAERVSVASLMTTGAQSDSEKPWTPLPIDGTPLTWREQARSEAIGYQISLQDEAGLINLDTAAPSAVAEVFTNAGLPADAALKIAAEIRDYVSTDLAVSVTGVTPNAYAEAGLPSPLQRPARTLSEIQGVLDWRGLMRQDVWRRAEPYLTTIPDSRTQNINTAPAEVLHALYGISTASAVGAVSRRAKAPLTDLADIGVARGDDFTIFTFPDGRLRLRFVDPRTGSFYQSTLVVTPGDLNRPIWIEDVRIQHGLRPLANESVAPGLFPEIRN